MTTAPTTPPASRALELLERSLGYARGVLTTVRGHRAEEPTPCADWDLADLLTHMVDGFTAFLQAASGHVPPLSPALPRDPTLLAGHLLDLGCGLLGDWTHPRITPCRVLGLPIPADAVMEVAALEVAVHSWDLSRVCAPEREVPNELAAALLPVLLRRVAAGDRPDRFAPPVTPQRRDPAATLLARLGRVA